MVRYEVLAEVGDPRAQTRRIRTQVTVSPHETLIETLAAIVALQQPCPRYWVQIDSVVEMPRERMMNP